MRFIAYFGKGAIVTDDYSYDEIKKGLHVDHIRSDLKQFGVPYTRLYDENMRYLFTVKA